MESISPSQCMGCSSSFLDEPHYYPHIYTLYTQQSSYESYWSFDKRIIFVRTYDTLKIIMIVKELPSSSYFQVGLVILVISMTISTQTSFGQTTSLDLTIYPDGSTHVFSEYSVNPLEHNFQINLFGSTIDNFVAIDSHGFLLSSELMNDLATIETFGSESVTIYYDTHDLVSKSGRIWTFDIDSPSAYTLLMPKNSVIIGMSGIPDNMNIIDDQSKLVLQGGHIQINYVFGSSPILPKDDPENNNTLPIIVTLALTAIIVASVAIIITVKRKQQTMLQEDIISSDKVSESHNEQKTQSEKPFDIKTIFDAIPDLREDDKEIITYIHENGGQILESELRKKFLKPRTTMWRAVKRLERYEIVEVEKKHLQNLIKLKKNKLEDYSE